jgi:L-ribulokinase
VFIGQTLATTPEDGYRALIEATAFGTRLIIETFRSSGVPVEELVVTGGLQKNPLVMQIYADVTRMPLHVLDSEQGPALGSAMHAAVAAGAYPDIRAAAASMGRVVRDAWKPDLGAAEKYDALYAEYVTLVDYFGRHGNDVMRRLRKIRREALS